MLALFLHVKTVGAGEKSAGTGGKGAGAGEKNRTRGIKVAYYRGKAITGR